VNTLSVFLPLCRIITNGIYLLHTTAASKDMFLYLFSMITDHQKWN